jgi:protein involved in polysaccharide export with SLBB domain
MRLLQRSVQHFIGMAGLAATVLIMAGCAHPPPAPPPHDGGTNDPESIDRIPLQNGDSIMVDLTTGTPQPITQGGGALNFTLNGTGNISLPLLETNIPAIGKSPHELEQIIHDLYVPKWYAHMSVTVTPGNRYFYVTGEVKDIASGKQLYTGNVTVLRAIGATGGFNDFAAWNRVQLTRQDGTSYIIDCKKALKDSKLDKEVLPGDKIFVDKQTPGEALFPWFRK